MTNYQNIVNDSNTNNEVDPLIKNLTPTPNQSPSYKRYLVGGIAALCFPAVGFHYSYFRARVFKDTCDVKSDNPCDGDQVCCPLSKKTLSGKIGKCVECCNSRQCVSKVEQPPAGEFGKMYCDQDTFTCEGKSGHVVNNSYPVWVPSETIDNSKVYQPYDMKREVISDDPEDPAYEVAWYFDFTEQDDISFDIELIESNGTHITMPSYNKMHAGYSKKYKHFQEEETGIVTLFISDNDYSVVADYPKLAFVEKYHTLTFKGKKDFARGEYMKDLSAKQVEETPKFNLRKWMLQAYVRVYALVGREKVILRQVQAGVDAALSWQMRRFVNTYDDDNSVTPSSSARWASHSTKAQEAIRLAKDPDFKREYLKSEQHCKHLEAGDGFTVDYTNDSITLPLGRPITTFSGEMVNAPTHYVGFGQGTMTVHYDKDTKILQLFFEGFGNSRQYSDVKFPGPHGNGLFVGPVAKGDNYIVDPDVDGRQDSMYKKNQPKDLRTKLFSSNEPDVKMWRQPLSDRCSDDTIGASFWSNIDISVTENSIYDSLDQSKSILKATVRGMACAPTWMKPDYGYGTSNFDAQEVGVWVHMLGETRDDWTEKMTLAPWWDEWECFYQNKTLTDCH